MIWMCNWTVDLERALPLCFDTKSQRQTKSTYPIISLNSFTQHFIVNPKMAFHHRMQLHIMQMDMDVYRNGYSVPYIVYAPVFSRCIRNAINVIHVKNWQYFLSMNKWTHTHTLTEELKATHTFASIWMSSECGFGLKFITQLYECVVYVWMYHNCMNEQWIVMANNEQQQWNHFSDEHARANERI